ncbi:hypothetical protein KFE25_008555 [Diacronema lutheri]|uniref:Uncharacterized protein n=1 Tax=Diacronema lutheri TaxID=2081491 RepID=A0A8J5Y2N8_DIALT|nr:hypothetical protein KFE25_008555 [Diacronema lutheri]
MGLVVGLAIGSSVVLAAHLLHTYADRKHCPWYVLLLVWVAWSLGLAFFLALPFDVSTTFYTRCVQAAEAAGEQGARACVLPPWGLVSGLVPFWTFVYWSSMLLGYLMADFLKDVIASGAFTVSGRVRASLRNGALFYVPFTLLGLAFIAYQLSRGSVTLDGLRAYCKAAANAFSLCLVVLMLGYGLVELPRYLWNKGDVEGQLRYLHFRASEYHDALAVASVRLGEALALLGACSEQVERNECVGDQSVLRRLCARVGAYAESDEREAVRKHTAEAAERLRAAPPPAPRMSEVEALNGRMKDALVAFRRARANYARTLRRAVAQTELSELLRQLDDASWDEQRSGARLGAHLAQRQQRGSCAALLALRCDRRYLRVTVQPHLWRALAAGCALLSLLVLVCETTIIFRDIVNLSILSYVLFLDPSGGVLFLCCFALPLAYMCCCVYFAFFRLKLFGLHALHSGQNSDYGTLLFNGTYMCRLAPALVYNYLNLLHEPHRADESGVSCAYLLGVGAMDVVPLFGSDYYNDLAPIAIILLCGCTYLNLFAHCGALCGSKTFQFDDSSDSEGIDAGAAIVRQELSRLARVADGPGRGAPLEHAEDEAARSDAPTADGVADSSPFVPVRASLASLALPASGRAATGGAHGAGAGVPAPGWRARLAAAKPQPPTSATLELPKAPRLPAALPDPRKLKGRYSQLDDGAQFGLGARGPSEQELADLEALPGLKGFDSL